MPVDQYGFETDREERAPSASPAAHAVAGVSAFVWLAASIVCCGMCSGMMGFSEPKADDGWMDQVGVWLILTAAAWPLAAIALWTGVLHGLARRWWTSVGPNVVLGSFTGCLAWVIVFFAWVIAVVVAES